MGTLVITVMSGVAFIVRNLIPFLKLVYDGIQIVTFVNTIVNPIHVILYIVIVVVDDVVIVVVAIIDKVIVVVVVVVINVFSDGQLPTSGLECRCGDAKACEYAS